MADFNESRLPDDEIARLNRLAIVLAAQLPNDAAKAMHVLRHVFRLVGTYRPKDEVGAACRYPKGNCCFLIDKESMPSEAQER